MDYTQENVLPLETEIKIILERAKDDAINNAKALEMEGVDFEQAVTCISLKESRVEGTLPTDLHEVYDVEDENLSENDSENEIIDIHENVYISDSEMEGIKQDLSIFSSLDDLSFRDNSEKHLKRNLKSRLNKNRDKNSPYLEVALKNRKIVTVRKSSLCWLFSEKQGRLSTDRLLRVRGSNGASNTPANKEKGIKKKKIQTSGSKALKSTRKRKKNATKKCALSDTETESSISSSISSSTAESYISESETLTEDFSSTDEMQHEVIIIEKEKYYAVFYDQKWYIGRVISEIENNQFQVKFLEDFMGNFSWPKTEDIALVKSTYIFYGPIHFKSYPFQLTRSDLLGINKKYKEFDKKLDKKLKNTAT